ncbi:MAG: YgiT-type zinc finger protein [bacterium]
MERKEKIVMMPFERCPVCNGEMVEKKVKKLLHGGVDTAIVKVKAEVCLHCGERLYTPEVVGLFEGIRLRLQHKETSSFKPVGQSFEVVC